MKNFIYASLLMLSFFSLFALLKKNNYPRENMEIDLSEYKLKIIEFTQVKYEESNEWNFLNEKPRSYILKFISENIREFRYYPSRSLSSEAIDKSNKKGYIAVFEKKDEVCLLDFNYSKGSLKSEKRYKEMILKSLSNLSKLDYDNPYSLFYELCPKMRGRNV